MSPCRVTIHDVAKKAGVSTTAVSFVLNNSGHVSAETRKRVLEAVEQLGYVPDRRARSLKSRRIQVLGLLFTYSEESMASSRYFRDITASICATASSYDYKVMVSLLSRQRSLAQQVKAFRQDGTIGGLIVAGPSPDQVETITENFQGFPTLILSAVCPHPGISFIDVDNRNGMLQAVGHLVRLGHRHIAYVTPQWTDSHSIERMESYRSAMEAFGLSGEIQLSILSPGGDGEDRLPQLLQAETTAIIAFDDLRALLVRSFLDRHGVRVPEDMALIGFDDEDFGVHMDPPLTTVAQPFGEMGKLATETLIERIENSALPSAHVTSPLTLIVRQSCGAHNRSAVRSDKSEQ